MEREMGKPDLAEEEEDSDRLWPVHGQQKLASAMDGIMRDTSGQQQFITTDPDHAPQSHLVLLPLGKTGDGKSSLLNTMLGYSEFKALTRVRSVTETIDERTGVWTVGKSNTIITVADTPGFADTNHRDALFQSQLRLYIQELGQRLGIDAFLLVFKYTSTSVMAVLETFAEMMKDMQPSTWWQHVVLVFTYVDYNPRPKSNVAQRKVFIAEKLTAQIQAKFGLAEAPPVVFVSSKDIVCTHQGALGIKCDCPLAHAYKNDRMRTLRRILTSISQGGRWVAQAG